MKVRRKLHQWDCPLNIFAWMRLPKNKTKQKNQTSDYTPGSRVWHRFQRSKPMLYNLGPNPKLQQEQPSKVSHTRETSRQIQRATLSRAWARLSSPHPSAPRHWGWCVEWPGRLGKSRCPICVQLPHQCMNAIWGLINRKPCTLGLGRRSRASFASH